ncbi:MAG TPA: hypothetical protein VI603_11995 [Saprospiraceae bacterium]|nr:hypothetical protein [Saprospiraceae bacterium]
MNSIENSLIHYSSKKLHQILDQQFSSYSPNFLEYVKDELIRRGETLSLNTILEKDITELPDEDLKKIVESTYEEYHLEYLEIARAEYIKRGFENESKEEFSDNSDDQNKSKYPALKTIAAIYNALAWIIGLVAVVVIVVLASKGGDYGMMLILPYIFIASFLILGVLFISESIKVFIDIERNTRKA